MAKAVELLYAWRIKNSSLRRFGAHLRAVKRCEAVNSTLGTCEWHAVVLQVGARQVNLTNNCKVLKGFERF